MKAIALFGTVLFVQAAVYAQGLFLFNAHDPARGNDVRFFFGFGDGRIEPASGPDLFVQVFLGTGPGPQLLALSPVLRLDQTGADAGYPNPSSQVYEVPGVPPGTPVEVFWAGYQGTDFTSGFTSTLGGGLGPVTLSAPGAPPNEVLTGSQTLVFVIPEPATWLLLFLGLGAITCYPRILRLERFTHAGADLRQRVRSPWGYPPRDH